MAISPAPSVIVLHDSGNGPMSTVSPSPAWLIAIRSV